EVARVGDAVERDDQRRGAAGHEVARVGVVVRPDLQGDALVDGVVGEPVELAAAGLQEGDARVGGQLDGLAYAVVGGGRHGVQGARRDAGAQRLHDGVAAGDDLGCVRRRTPRATLGGRGRGRTPVGRGGTPVGRGRTPVGLGGAPVAGRGGAPAGRG